MDLTNLVICLKGGGYVHSTINKGGQLDVSTALMEQLVAFRVGLEGSKPIYAMKNADGAFTTMALFEEIAGFYFSDIKESTQERLAAAHEEMVRELKKQSRDGDNWKNEE